MHGAFIKCFNNDKLILRFSLPIKYTFSPTKTTKQIDNGTSELQTSIS
jgi:hypothetical protein